MGLFGFGERNFASIVAPLRTIEADLTAYITEQDNTKTALEEEKAEIEQKIGVTVSEKEKSVHTVAKIADLLGADIDMNGVADADELPPPSDEEEPPPDQPVS